MATSPRRFLSVSDRYRTGAAQGHTFSHQVALAGAAERGGHTFDIAAPAQRVAPDDSLVTLRLASRDWSTIAREVAEHLRGMPPHTVLVYEGSLEALAAFRTVADLLEGHVVVLNLFRTEWPLDVPRDAPRGVGGRSTARTDPGPARSPDGPLPANLVVLADTARRAFLARSSGIDVCGVWPIQSILATPSGSGGPSSLGRRGEPDPSEVVIALSGWQLKGDPGTQRDLADVLRSAARRAPRLRFTLLGAVDDRYGSRGLRRRLRALPGSADGPLERSDYASRLEGAGVVWPPKRDQYATQSSGKAVDALVAGRPVLLPSGSAGQVEQERWIPGAPSYRSRTELWDLLAALPDLVGPWAEVLAARRQEILTHYSPDRTLEVLIAHAERSG